MKPNNTSTAPPHSLLSHLTLKFVFPLIEPRDPPTYYDTTTSTTNATPQKTTYYTNIHHSLLAITLLSSITCLLFLFFLFLFLRHRGLFDHYLIDRSRRGRNNGAMGARGVDPCVIESLPVLAFEVVRREMGSVDDCAVCLGEFECKSVVKRIPFCGHFFHAQCIEVWLLNHSSCPLCRSSQLFPLPPKVTTHHHHHDHVDRDCKVEEEKFGSVVIDVGAPTTNFSSN
ncbi:hypothetical protein Syun_000659 [Stephania yunnanensis]|uniref:RING-type E3 ubiquitin transferase n=1 Tax=Stephania yunnanensis TaxID=152371 RepID=A0AAP0Q6Z5_9MAGN